MEDFMNRKDLNIDQFQLKKLRGENEDLFQEDIDLEIFPNLFPNNENWIRKIAKAFQVRNAEYI